MLDGHPGACVASSSRWWTAFPIVWAPLGGACSTEVEDTGSPESDPPLACDDVSLEEVQAAISVGVRFVLPDNGVPARRNGVGWVQR